VHVFHPLSIRLIGIALFYIEILGYLSEDTHNFIITRLNFSFNGILVANRCTLKYVARTYQITPMPYLIYDVESAKESGFHDHPISTLRKLGAREVELIAGHEEIGVVKLYVEELNFELPAFITIDPEAPRKTITVIYNPSKKQHPSN
jgi:hypothetical protein